MACSRISSTHDQKWKHNIKTREKVKEQDQSVKNRMLEYERLELQAQFRNFSDVGHLCN